MRFCCCCLCRHQHTALLTHTPPPPTQKKPTKKTLNSRFQQVYVDAPSVAQTVSILRGLRPKYETHHGLRISDAALAAAAALSERYLPER